MTHTVTRQMPQFLLSICGALVLILTGCALIPVDSRHNHAHSPPPPQSLVSQLERDVRTLAGDIGPRNTKRPLALKAAENHIAASLARMGYQVQWQSYFVGDVECSNLIAEKRGTTLPNEIVIVGAHYDSVDHRGKVTPGADDNASGCAGTLALARDLFNTSNSRTIRFVFFTNEEPPHFWTDAMGSLVYARACKDRSDNIVAMISLEMIGYFRDDKGSQSYPPLVGLSMPSEGNFIAFVSFATAEPLVNRCVETFKSNTDFPVAGAAMPTLVPRIGSSDHWSFWKQGYPSLMVTDTAINRNRNYHTMDDTPDTLDYHCMARVVEGTKAVLLDLANNPLSWGTPATPATNPQ